MSCFAQYEHAAHRTATGERCDGFTGEYHANSHQTADAGRVFIGHICEKGPHFAFVGEGGYGECGSHYFAGIYVTVDPNVSRRGDIADPVEVAKDLAESLSELDRLRSAAEWGGQGDAMTTDESAELSD